MTIQIKGKPYYLEENEFGWGVMSTEKKTDRFHKNYQVLRGKNGAPKSCSCPDHMERGRYTGTPCKHMLAILDQYSAVESVEAHRPYGIELPDGAFLPHDPEEN